MNKRYIIGLMALVILMGSVVENSKFEEPHSKQARNSKNHIRNILISDFIFISNFNIPISNFTSPSFLIPAVHAEDIKISGETCKQKVIELMTAEHDEYRAHLFGTVQEGSGDDVKYFAKTGGEVKDKVTGIFETKQRMGSDLIEPLIESYRVFRCRANALCQAAGKSFFAEKGQANVKVSSLGCAAPTELPVIAECRFVDETSNASLLEEGNVLGFCQSLAAETLKMERAALTLAVAYDSNYRGGLQFAGIFDHALTEIPRYAFTPLRTMVSLLGRLHQIPCFLGQCDARQP